jgi:hypothetical protein
MSTHRAVPHLCPLHRQNSPMIGSGPSLGKGPRRAMCGRLQTVNGLCARQRWSVQPCVRPFDAGHSAGHSAFRGSGPCKLVFDDALAGLGRSDHRIDRSELRAVGPFQPFVHAVLRRNLASLPCPTSLGRLALVWLSLGHDGPAILASLLASAIAATFVGRPRVTRRATADALCRGFARVE